MVVIAGEGYPISLVLALALALLPAMENGGNLKFWTTKNKKQLV